MKQELTIEIPDGKIVDWDESKKQNKIVFRNKQLTYENICEKLFPANNFYYINENGKIVKSGEGVSPFLLDANNAATKHQLECILAKNKLANVTKYLNDGWEPKPSDTSYGLVLEGKQRSISFPLYSWDTDSCYLPQFAFRYYELAQQAIEILGEETVKLALEPLGI